MIATVQQVKGYYIVRFDIEFQHPLQAVWVMLASNGKLKQWFTKIWIDLI